MTNKEDAISITKHFLLSSDTYQSFVVDIENIDERETLWYVPFLELNPDPNKVFVGARNGLIIDKESTDYLQPGSSLTLEKWIYGFKIGLRGKRYDLHIEKVNDYRATLDLLDKLGLTYVKIEMEGGTAWKIPKSFKRKEIKKRLDKIPCVFKNQAFTFSISEFKQIRNEKMFEYRLSETENADPKILGELIND